MIFLHNTHNIYPEHMYTLMNSNILLIDDNEDVRSNVAELLSLTGYRVLVAEDGKEGIELAKTFIPDLIVCDVMMPNIDGWGVKHILSKETRTRDIPFIFLTAKTEKADFRTAIELGANDYITKPFQTNELLNSIEAVLRKTKQADRIAEENITEQDEPDIPTSNDPLAALIDTSEVRECKKKDTIYKEGTASRYLYYIKSGKVKTYKVHEDGKELVLALYGEGDFVGYMSILNNSANTESAKAIDDTELVMVPKKDFEKLLENNLEVNKKFLDIVAHGLVQREKQLLGIAYNTLRKKVAEALLILDKKYNKSHNGHFSFQFGRDDLASIAGTATESLVRTLTDFKAEKLIDMKNGSIIVTNKKKLETLIS